MLKCRIRRNALDAAKAIKLMAEIRASIVSLPDEDLLDLADIFHDTKTTLETIATAEMQHRNLKL